jgi:hypothetical protein
LLVDDAWLLIAMVAVRANESDVFVINDPDADVELIDPIYNDLDVRASQSPKYDALPRSPHRGFAPAEPEQMGSSVPMTMGTSNCFTSFLA